MKIHRLFVIAGLLTMLLALAAVWPVSANAEKTPFTAVCGFGPEPPSPDVRMWWTGQDEVHIRDEVQAMICDFSDDRLDGEYWAVVNWDGKWYTDPFEYLIGHDYGQMTLKDAGGNLLWHGFRNTFYTAPWVVNGTLVLNGSGMYSGLTVKATVRADLIYDSNVYLEGEIIEHGN